MSQYVLDHHLEGEKKRLALMSQLLDPMHRRYIESLGISRDARVLEVGCGNGSMSAWMAGHVAPDGQIVAIDLDLSLVNDARAPGVEFRKGDIVTGPVDPGRFDFVTARAVLHHVSNAEAAIDNLVASLRPGGIILLVEPDFLPVSVAEPMEIRTFWNGWLTWSRERSIDYHIGRTLAPRLAAHGLKEIGGAAETAVYNGGSPGRTTGVRRSLSCVVIWHNLANLMTCSSRRSSLVAPTRTGGHRQSHLPPFTHALRRQKHVKRGIGVATRR
jgi:SAM-dependent methyltransferase